MPMATIGFRAPARVDPVHAAANLGLAEDDVATIEGKD
jgi:hypothetical protein